MCSISHYNLNMACFAMFCYKLSKLAVFIESGKS
nr:MAG TPA: hypothetical protein [Caudoviricetes sp.]